MQIEKFQTLATKMLNDKDLSNKGPNMKGQAQSCTLKVIEGRGLASKDPNGMSDPYCLIGLPTLSRSEFLDLKQCFRSEVLFMLLLFFI